MSIAKRYGLSIILGLCLLSQSGCLTLSALLGESKSSTLDTSMLEAQGYSIPPGGMPSPVASDPDSGPRIILEVRDGDRHLESIPMPTDRAVFIEDIVQQAQLHERIGQLVINIMRPSKQGGPPIRMETRTDDSGKVTNIGQNYALMPGDHLVVSGDNRSGLERIIDKHFRNR